MSYFLIIDDDATCRRMLSCALERLGYRTTAVNSPSLAIGRLHREAPAVIVSDVMMPGCSGPTLANMLLQHPNGKDAELVFYTALNTVAWWQQPATVITKTTPLTQVVQQLIDIYKTTERKVS